MIMGTEELRVVVGGVFFWMVWETKGHFDTYTYASGSSLIRE